MTRIVCPSCGAIYQVAEEFMGKKLVCHHCQARLLWTSAGVEVIEAPVTTFPQPEPTELVAELQPEEPDVLDEPEPPAEEAEPPADEPEPPMEPAPPMPRHVRYRKQPKSLVMPILVIALTALVTLGVVVCAVVLLVMGLSGSDRNQAGRGHPPAPMPTFMAPTEPWPGGVPGGPPVDANEKADFTVASVEKIGMVSYQPAGPIAETTADAAPRSTNQPTPEFVRRVKQASVFIRVNRRDGAGTGSGFFCLEPGLIITNAHVVGMLRPSDPPPNKIEVTLNSGEANAKELTARVVAVDRVNDLAALRVEPSGSTLPPPFSLYPSSQLIETQSVFVAGFPRVSELGTSLSVGTGSIAALRKDAGRMRKVQVNGNMQPGNSGGPVFDTHGRVVGVSASILGQTGINFAVPTEFINDLVYGGVERLVVFPPVTMEASTRLPVLVRISDALLRVNDVEVESWVGRAGEPRPPSFEKPTPEDGDGEIQRTKLATARSRGQITARGMVPIPKLTNGQVVYLRVVLPSATGKTRWFTAVPHRPAKAQVRTMEAPVAKAADAVTVACRTQLRVQIPGGELSISPLGLYHEHHFVMPPGGDKDPTKVRYLQFNIGARANDLPLPMGQVQQFLQNSAAMGAALVHRMDLKTLSEPAKMRLGGVVDYALQLAAIRQLNLPSDGAPLGTQWTTKMALPFSVLIGRIELKDLVVGCTSLGTDNGEGGSGDLLVELVGEIRTQQDLPGIGWMRGLARLDPQTGRVRSLQIAADVEVENFLPQGVPLVVNGRPAVGISMFLNGRVEYLVEHGPAAAAPTPPAGDGGP